MDAYVFVSLGHVLFFSTTRNMVWQIIQHETPTSHLSPLSCHPANSHLNLSSATFHFSPFTSHLSPPMPLNPHLSRLTLTAHLPQSPLTLTSNPHQDSDSLKPSRTRALTLTLTLTLPLTPTLDLAPTLTLTLTYTLIFSPDAILR